MTYLQPDKGKSTRHICPSCKTKLSFTLYLNGATHEPIHSTVGKCNREIKCGYHYPPRQYFFENPSTSRPCTDEACLVSHVQSSKPLLHRTHEVYNPLRNGSLLPLGEVGWGLTMSKNSFPFKAISTNFSPPSSPHPKSNKPPKTTSSEPPNQAPSSSGKSTHMPKSAPVKLCNTTH